MAPFHGPACDQDAQPMKASTLLSSPRRRSAPCLNRWRTGFGAAVLAFTVSAASAGPSSSESDMSGSQASRAPGTSIAQQCERFYGAPGWKPVTGAAPGTSAQDDRPVKGLPVIDVANRTCIVRVTDHDADLHSGFARNDYSRRQAFNADDSRLLIIAQDGSWHLYASDDFRYLGRLPGLSGDAEPQWNVSDPSKLYYLPGSGVGMVIKELDVQTGRSRTVADLAQRVREVWPSANSLWTRSEGSPSRDQRYWAFQVDDAKWKGLGMLSYDMKEDRIVATYDFAREHQSRPDHLSVSPSGQYIVVSWLDGVTAFRFDFSEPRVIHKKSEHSDLAIDKNGEDVYVSIDYDASGGPLFSTNLRTGRRTALLKTYQAGTGTALHISGKAFARPGWVLVSTYADSSKGAPQWFHRKLFAMSLDADPRIINLAEHRSQYDEYWTEPHASTNRNLTRVLFNSNWGKRSKTDVDTFLVMVPEKAFAPPSGPRN